VDLGLKGKKALVLGASRGLGRAIAHRLAEEGADVVVSARSADKLEALAAEIKAQHGVEASPVPCDMTDRASIDALIENIRINIKPDILINNSGGPPPSGAIGVTDEVWRNSAEALMFSVIRITEAAIENMHEKKWGRILTVASSGVIQPLPNLAVSNTIRSAIVGFSKTLAGEVAKDGITVNLIVPGKIDTERVGELDTARAKREDKTLDEVRAAIRATLPAQRYGTPEEFAGVAAFLVSEPAAYITGQMTRVDGGMIRAV
jgi:3-oxoacyl-[acyl-carrier protein] reductase